MRVVTLRAVANRGGMDLSLNVSGLFVGMAGDAEGHRGGRGQLYAGSFLVNPNFVAGCAAHGYRRMDRLTFSLVLMALDTGSGILLGVKWNRMNNRPSRRSQHASHYHDRD